MTGTFISLIKIWVKAVERNAIALGNYTFCEQLAKIGKNRAISFSKLHCKKFLSAFLYVIPLLGTNIWSGYF